MPMISALFIFVDTFSQSWNLLNDWISSLVWFLIMSRAKVDIGPWSELHIYDIVVFEIAQNARKETLKSFFTIVSGHTFFLWKDSKQRRGEYLSVFQMSLARLRRRQSLIFKTGTRCIYGEAFRHRKSNSFAFSREPDTSFAMTAVKNIRPVAKKLGCNIGVVASCFWIGNLTGNRLCSSKKQSIIDSADFWQSELIPAS